MSLKLGGKSSKNTSRFGKRENDTKKSKGRRDNSSDGDFDLSDSLERGGKPKSSLGLNKGKARGGQPTPSLGLGKKPSRRPGRINDTFTTKSDGRRSMGSSKRKSHRKNSPEFGFQDNGSDQRLETFGNREERPKKNYKGGLDIDNDEKSRGAQTSYNWNKDKSKDRRDKDRGRNSSKPPAGAGSKYSSRGRNDSRDRSRSRNRDQKSGFRDGRSQRSRNPSQKGASEKKSRATSSYDDPRFEKHMSAKIAKSSRKTLNFNEKKEKREKEWLLEYQSHKPLVHLIDRFGQPPKKTQSYLITLEKVKNIPHNEFPLIKEKGVTTTLNYCCTLFDEEEREFFGRSYTSRPIKLDRKFESTEDRSRDFLFMHTQEEDAKLVLIIETYLEIIELDKGEKTTYISLGFAKFQLFGAKGTAVATPLPMFKGSPRSLMLKVPFEKFLVNKCTLVAQIKEYNALNKLKALIPSTTLCGMKDIIPGLVGSKMALKRDQINLCGTEDLILTNMQVETGRGFEKMFMRSLEDSIYQQYKLDKEEAPKATLLRLGSPMISERKMYVTFNNSWKVADDSMFISLESPNDSFNTYQAMGHIEVKDFIIDPNTALVFKIEFVVNMPTAVRKKKEKLTYTVAWGYFLPTYNAEGEVQSGTLNCDLKFGPGLTPDGSMLWTPEVSVNEEDLTIEILGDIDPKGKFDPRSVKKVISRDNPPEVNIDRVKGKDSDLFDIEKSPRGDNRLPVGDTTVNRNLRRQLEKEAREKEQLKKKMENLEIRNQSYKDQLGNKYKGEAGRLEEDINDAKRDERKNMEILKKKFQRREEESRGAYEGRIKELEMELKRSKSRRGSKYRGDKRDGTLSPPRVDRSDILEHPNTAPVHQLPYAPNYMADPSMYFPSFYPPDDRSRLIGQSRYIDEDLKILPPPPQVPLELPTTFDLSRDDEIAFVKLGIKEEILKYDHYDQPDLDVELKNPLQASEFSLKFIAFKPPLSMPFGRSVPRRMYFKYNFFTFPETTTEGCKIKDPDGRTDLIRELVPGQQYILDRIGKSKVSEYRSIENEFVIDRTVSKVSDENKQFYKYLLQRDLSINIYDADSHILYGTCCVNLKGLLRQTRTGIVRARNCEIAAFESSNRSITGAVNMGNLQILMSHQGRKEAEVNNLDKEQNYATNDHFEDRKQPSQRFNKKVKSKPIQGLIEEYVADKPDDIYEKIIEPPMHLDEEDAEDIRKKMRVERLKKFQFKQKVYRDAEDRMRHAHRPEEIINVMADPTKPDWVKKYSLREIETLRDFNKHHVIDQVLQDHIKDLKHLYITPGTPSFFKYKLKNPFVSRTVFTVNISDPDKVYLGETTEFKLVNNRNFEWEFWNEKRECEAPYSWDMVNKSNEIMLEPGEECELLFKYITFREFDPLKQSSEHYIKERAVLLTFEYSSHKEGKGQVFNTRVVVTPKKPPIDFTITFDEPPSSHASLTIPASFYADPYQAYCSDTSIV